MATYYDPARKVWYGEKSKVLFGPDMTLAEVALYILEKAPNKVLEVMDPSGEELTAGQISSEVKIIAKNLLKLGINIGDVIGFSVHASRHLTSILLAVLLCGAPINAVHADFDTETIKSIFGTTTPKLIFCDAVSYKNTKAACEELNLNAEFFIVEGEVAGVRNLNELLIDDGTWVNINKFPCSKLTSDDLAVLLCTSGTTGAPSVIQCSHKPFLKGASGNSFSDSTLLIYSSIYWLSGFNGIFMGILSLAKRIISREPFTPEYFVHLVEKYKATHVGGNPNQFSMVLQLKDNKIAQRFSSVRGIFTYGSTTPRIVCDELNKILKENNAQDLVILYGMSEIIYGGTINIRSSQKRTEGNAGKIISNSTFRIVDENGNNRGINEQGRIHIKVEHKLLGYYRNPEANKKAFMDDGWFVTSDIGYFDEDGDLHICARQNDIFKSKNFAIFPEQIEEVILKVPGVAEACIFGIPDVIATNLIACAIVRTNDEAGRNLTATDITEEVAKHKAPCYHIKGGVYFVDKFPRTVTGKVQRRKILDLIKDSQKL